MSRIEFDKAFSMFRDEFNKWILEQFPSADRDKFVEIEEEPHYFEWFMDSKHPELEVI